MENPIFHIIGIATQEVVNCMREVMQELIHQRKNSNQNLTKTKITTRKKSITLHYENMGPKQKNITLKIEFMNYCSK